jgi:hypothetical protein
MPLYRGYSEPGIQIRQGGLELGRQGQARADVRDQEGIITMATQIQDEQRRRDASLLFGESTTRPEDALLLGLAGPVQRLSIRESIDRIARAGLVQNDVDQSLALEDLRHQQALEDIERIANAGRDVSNLMAREDSQHQRALQDMERGVVIALEDMDRASEGEEDRARAELMRKIDALRARLERPRSSSRRVIEAAQNTAAADQSGSANLMPPPPPPSRRRFPPAIARGRSREAAELRQVMSAASSTERGSEASRGSASSRGRSRRSIPLSLASELSAPSSSAVRGRPQSQSTASPNLDTPSEARRKRGRAP